MWLLAFAIYVGCKWLTWRRTPAPDAPLGRHAGYLLAWPGLDAGAFLNGGRDQVKPPTTGEWLFAFAKTVFGIGVVYAVTPLLPSDRPYLIGWVGMIGLIFVLHFGMFHLLSCAWRSAGVPAKPLMNWPIATTSVSDFWGRRWNTAFRDLTHRFLFRPLAAHIDPRWAVFAGFTFSGLIHDVVISVPAGGGYGGPTAFFAIQGLALLAERTWVMKRFGLHSGWGSRLFCALVLICPAPLLFHPPFVERVIVPFLATVGAIS
jgi:Membrane bound O-acyl transferase family